jgi:hypothetical protein
MALIHRWPSTPHLTFLTSFAMPISFKEGAVALGSKDDEANPSAHRLCARKKDVRRNPSGSLRSESIHAQRRHRTKPERCSVATSLNARAWMLVEPAWLAYSQAKCRATDAPTGLLSDQQPLGQPCRERASHPLPSCNLVDQLGHSVKRGTPASEQIRKCQRCRTMQKVHSTCRYV